jgi:hypothetical protein
MIKRSQSISILIILALILGIKSVYANNDHRITQLKIETDPTKPVKNRPVNKLSVKFKLQSSTGIDRSRVLLLLNNSTVDLNEGLEIERLDNEFNPDKGLEFANITIDKPEIVFNKDSNKLELLYLISAINKESPLVKRSFIVESRAGSESNNNNDDDNENDSGSNEAALTPRLIRILVSQINGDSMVSEAARRFRLTVFHDESVLAKVNKDNFNAITNPILNNLKIISRNPSNPKERTEITNKFSFSLDGNGSVSSSQYASIKNQQRTVFISNEQIIKEKQDLVFRINLQKFINRLGVNVDDSVIKNDRTIIKISELKSNFKTIKINTPDEIQFTSNAKQKNKFIFNSETIFINGVLEGGPKISTVNNVSFQRIRPNGTKRNPLIKIAKKRHGMKINLAGSTSFSSSGDEQNIIIPSSFRVVAGQKVLRSKRLDNSELLKKLDIPITVLAKTKNGLEMSISGILESDKVLEFIIPEQ